MASLQGGMGLDLFEVADIANFEVLAIILKVNMGILEVDHERSIFGDDKT